MSDVNIPVDRVTYSVISSLLAVSPGNAPRAVPALEPEITAEELFEVALRMHLVNFVAYAYRSDPRVANPTSPFVRYQELGSVVLSRQVAELRALSGLFGRHKVPFLVFKGLYAYNAALTVKPRIMADVDIIVRPRDLERARDLVCSLGYTQGDADISKMRRVERIRYELAAFSRVTYLDGLSPETAAFAREYGLNWYETERMAGYIVPPTGALPWQLMIDVHHNVLLPKVPLDELWRQPAKLLINGMRLNAVRPALLFWVLCIRAYRELVRGDQTAARMLGEALLIMGRDPIDFVSFARFCEMTRTCRQAFFQLDFLQRFCQAPVPAGALTLLRRRGRAEPYRRPRFNPGNQDISWSELDHNGGDSVPSLVGQTPTSADRWARYNLVLDADRTVATSSQPAHGRELGELQLPSGLRVSVKI